MKKLLLRLFLLALPFALYFGVFVAFDPADYFGVNGAVTADNSMVTRVKRFLEDPQDAVILGDSRMAHFDMALVEQVTGRPWSNLAFGGASMNESVDLFELALEENPDIDTVVFEASFYTLREGDARNRTDAILTAVQNPVAYLFNFNYNADMLQNILENVKHWMDPSYIVGEATDTGHWTDADYVDENGAPLPCFSRSSASHMPVSVAWQVSHNSSKTSRASATRGIFASIFLRISAGSMSIWMIRVRRSKTPGWRIARSPARVPIKIRRSEWWMA